MLPVISSLCAFNTAIIASIHNYTSSGDALKAGGKTAIAVISPISDRTMLSLFIVSIILIMAKQAGTYHITGCIDHLCFYEMEGKYYVRQKSPLTGKRVKKDPAFKRTMQYAALLASASAIASAVYKTLPKGSKGVALYRVLTGKVMRLLRGGKTADEILKMLKQPVKKPPVKRKDHLAKRVVDPHLYADILIARLFVNGLPQEEYKAHMPADVVPP